MKPFQFDFPIFKALMGAAVFMAIWASGTAESWAAARPGVDVMFVIDNSGSMKKNDPHYLTPKMVRAFLQQLPQETRVGMVMFDEKSRLLEPLSAMSDVQAKQRLVASLDHIDYKGRYTHSPAGIERALYELKTKGHPEAQKCIIFLTDGIVDTGNPARDRALIQWLKNELAAESHTLGVRIFGIAFTENADFALIQALAAHTEGAYYRAYEAKDISDVLDQIQGRLSALQHAAPQTLPTVSPATPQASAPLESPAAIEASSTSAQSPTPAQNARGFWKFYLPLVVIIFLLIGLLLFLFIKVYGRPIGGGFNIKRFGFPLRSSSTADAPPMALPDWQLQDLDQACLSAGGIFSPNKVRVTIGRDTKNDISIPQPTVSSQHAIIEYKEGAFYLEDQRSTNGTRLNNHLLSANQPVRLKSGDRIKFANFEFKFVRLDQIISGDTIMLAVTSLAPHDDDLQPSAPLLDGDEERHMRICLEQHLAQIDTLGPKYKEFSHRNFSPEIIQMLSIQAHENMQQTLNDGNQHCSPLIKGRVFYVVCTLPVPIADTTAWFSRHFGGFTRFIIKWIKSDAYDVTACDLFSIITFGRDQGPWVSMTIVPTHEDSDSVEIMSVEFLAEAEKASLGLDFDNHGRVL